MEHTDRFELPLSTSSEKAAQLYCDGVDQLLAYQANSVDTLELAITQDPGFAMAYIARARALQMRAQIVDAKLAATKARELVANASEREQQHVEILALVIESHPAQALSLLLQHCTQWPRDALPMSTALGAIGLFAFSGRPDSRMREREFLASVAEHWSVHWWFDTYYGWVLVETGEHAQGNALLDRALPAYPKNAQAVHARAHGYYESGEIAPGQAFVAEQLLRLDADSLLIPHLRWHQALMALQTGDTAGAKAIYQEAIAPGVSKAMPLLLMMDAASFAWRCHVYGEPLSEPQLREVQAQANACLPAAGPSFFNWHKALALASAKDQQGLTQLSGEVDDLIAAGKQPPGEVMQWICRALVAASADRWSEAGDYLEKANQQVGAIGGSSAQQDAITDALVAACLASDRRSRAADLIQERSATRAPHLDRSWLERISAH